MLKEARFHPAAAREQESRSCSRELLDLVSGKKVSDIASNVVGLLVEGEVTGVDHGYFGLWKFPLVGLRFRCLERRVVAPPNDQRWRLRSLHPDLPVCKACLVRPVVVEQISLDFGLARPAEEGELVRPEIGVVVGNIRA